jgi:GDP-D-mannose 3',5'-epimerase
MGGMGFIENNKALCMLSVLTNTHLLMAAREQGVERFFLLLFGVRLQRGQADESGCGRAERRGRLPRDAGGWLRVGEAVQRAHVPSLSKRIWPTDAGRALSQRVRTARHLDGGREKAPAAICRKVIQAKMRRQA